MKKAQKSTSTTLYRLLKRYDGRADEYDASSAYTEQKSRELRSRLNAPKKKAPYEYEASPAESTEPRERVRQSTRGKRETGKADARARQRKNVRSVLGTEARRFNPKPFEFESTDFPKNETENTAEKFSTRGAGEKEKKRTDAPQKTVPTDKGNEAERRGGEISLSFYELWVLGLISLSLLQIIISLLILIIV